MSAVTGYFNEAGAAAQAGYGLYNQLDRALHGDKTKVHFVQGNVTILEFDIVLNEGHSFTVTPSSFPIESGSVVADHSIVAPIQLSLTGLISDYPVETKNQLLNSTTTSIITAATTPLGSVGVLGATVGYSALRAQQTSTSRSAKIFDDLQRMAGFPSEQRPTAQPQLFDVITRLRRYPNMQIMQLQLNRDSTSGPTNMVFTLQLQQVQIAYARSALVKTWKPEKTARKQSVGESETKKNALTEANQAGRDLATSQQQGPKEVILKALPGKQGT